MQRLKTVPIPKRIYTFQNPRLIKRPTVIPRAEWNIVDTSYIVGKGMTLLLVSILTYNGSITAINEKVSKVFIFGSKIIYEFSIHKT